MTLEELNAWLEKQWGRLDTQQVMREHHEKIAEFVRDEVARLFDEHKPTVAIVNTSFGTVPVRTQAGG